MNQNLKQFLTTLYTGLYQRSPDDDGMVYWADAYASGETCYSIAKSFLLQNEIKPLRSLVSPNELGVNMVYLTRLYYGLLGREPDTGGLVYWRESLQTGLDVNHLDESFLQSNEFKLRCQMLDLN